MDVRSEAQGLGPRAQEALSDSQLDREIESAVGIEPSPEFLARVRTRIAAEPQPSVWRLADVVSAFRRTAVEPLWGVAIAGIVLAIVVPQFIREDAVVSTVERSIARRAIEVPAAGAPVGADLQVGPTPIASSRTRPRAVVVHDRAESPHTLPLQLSPVQFAEEDRLAFAWFAAAVAEGIVPEEKVVQVLGEEDMAPLAITSLVIDPLPPLARVDREGEGQW